MPPSAADSWDNGDLCAVRYGCLKATCVTDIFVTDEYVDVFPNLSLLSYHTASNARVLFPKGLQGLRESGCGLLDDDTALSGGERTQGARYDKGNRHSTLSFGS